jgi:hypothetical protein
MRCTRLPKPKVASSSLVVRLLRNPSRGKEKVGLILHAVGWVGPIETDGSTNWWFVWGAVIMGAYTALAFLYFGVRNAIEWHAERREPDHANAIAEHRPTRP